MGLVNWIKRFFENEIKQQTDRTPIENEERPIRRYDQDTESRLIFVSKRDLYVPLKYLEMDGEKVIASVRSKTKDSESSGYGVWLPIHSERSWSFYQENYFSSEKVSKLPFLKKARDLVEQPLISGHELTIARERSNEILLDSEDNFYSNKPNELTKLIVEWHLGLSISPLSADHLNELIVSGYNSFAHLFTLEKSELVALKGIGENKANDFKNKFRNMDS